MSSTSTRADATKNYVADVLVEADAALAARALAPALPPAGADVGPTSPPSARRARGSLRGDASARVAFLEDFARAVPDDVTVVADMCIPGYWLAGMYTPAGPRRLQYPMGWGTLGYAFPAALGAALPRRADASRSAGDGGFLFACGELATVAQEGSR